MSEIDFDIRITATIDDPDEADKYNELSYRQQREVDSEVEAYLKAMMPSDDDLSAGGFQWSIVVRGE